MLKQYNRNNKAALANQKPKQRDEWFWKAAKDEEEPVNHVETHSATFVAQRRGGITVTFMCKYFKPSTVVQYHLI